MKNERRPNRRTSSETQRLVHLALELLAKARTMGLQRQKDIWQYAVVRDELLGLGLTGADLRDLIRKGLVDHGREVTTPSQRRRRFEKLNNLSLGKRSCFVLSEQGLHELTRDNPIRKRHPPLRKSQNGTRETESSGTLAAWSNGIGSLRITRSKSSPRSSAGAGRRLSTTLSSARRD
jgi:hypothetical protein